MKRSEVLHIMFRAIIQAGYLWVIVPPLETEPEPGPPPRHPERLRPDLPLSEIERMLERELTWR